MAFGSILFDRPAAYPEVREAPACFADLRLDRVIAAVVAGREEYDLTPWLYDANRDAATVAWRHEVFQDLESELVYQAADEFAARMRGVRQLLRAAEQARYPYQPQRHTVDAAAAYSDAVTGLRDALNAVPLQSRGLRAWRDWLTGYIDSPRFTSLVADTRVLLAELGQVRYTVRLHGSRVTVGHYHDEADYRSEVTATFDRFPYPPVAATDTRGLARRPSWDRYQRRHGVDHVDA